MPTIPGIPESSVNREAMPHNPMVPIPAIEMPNPAEGLAQSIHKYRLMADQARVAEATNELDKQRINLTADYSKQMGANVLPDAQGQTFTDRYTSQLNDAASSISQNLTPRQRQMFEQQAAVTAVQFQGAVQNHETQQLYEHNVNTWGNKIELATQTAAQSYNDPAALGKAQGDIDEAVRQLAVLKGMDREGAQLLAQKAHDQFSTSVIGKFMERKEWAGARAYFNAHISDMTPATAAKVDDILKKNENLSAMTDTVQNVWNDKSLTYEQKTDALLQRYKDDPDTQKAAIEQLHLHQGAYKQAQDEAYGTVRDMYSGLNPSTPKLNMKQIHASVEWGKLDGERREEFQKKIELWNRQLAGTTSPQEDYERCLAFNSYVLHPDKLLAMDEPALKAIAPTLGPQYFHQLVGYRTELVNNRVKLDNVTLDSAQLKIAGENLGYISGRRMSLAQAKDWASFNSQAIMAVRALNNRLGRQATDMEQKQVFDRLSANHITQKTLLGIHYNSSVPMYRAVDNLPYPDDQKQKAEQWLWQNSLEATPENVTKTIEEVFPAMAKGKGH